jgi:hypothetical protein
MRALAFSASITCFYHIAEITMPLLFFAGHNYCRGKFVPLFKPIDDLCADSVDELLVFHHIHLPTAFAVTDDAKGFVVKADLEFVTKAFCTGLSDGNAFAPVFFAIVFELQFDRRLLELIDVFLEEFD